MNFDNFNPNDFPNNDQSGHNSLRNSNMKQQINYDLANNINFNQNLQKLANAQNRSLNNSY